MNFLIRYFNNSILLISIWSYIKNLFIVKLFIFLLSFNYLVLCEFQYYTIDLNLYKKLAVEFI